ncbi:hypothetical protein [Chryseobacterium proteolyticum]|uniref:hypothetical protein n=1 Tax=Chryseobacterium proteolyticum TaxID=118127 RepID=UPI0039833646
MQRGGTGTDNYYEKPFHQVDFVYQGQLTKNWNVKFAVQNILDSKYRILLGEDKSYLPLRVEDGSNVLTDYYRGVTFNLTVGYTF